MMWEAYEKTKSTSQLLDGQKIKVFAHPHPIGIIQGYCLLLQW